MWKHNLQNRERERESNSSDPHEFRIQPSNWPTNWSVEGEGRSFRSYCHSGVICIVEMHRFRSKPPLQVRKLPFSRSSSRWGLRVSLGLREDTPEETEPLIRGRGIYPRLFTPRPCVSCLDWDSIAMCREILYEVRRKTFGEILFFLFLYILLRCIIISAFLLIH